LLILSGEVDHLIPRPGQVGDVTFAPIDLDVWEQTGERVAEQEAVRSTPRRMTGGRS
jgi:hypothetical protein